MGTAGWEFNLLRCGVRVARYCLPPPPGDGKLGALVSKAAHSGAAVPVAVPVRCDQLELLELLHKVHCASPAALRALLSEVTSSGESETPEKLSINWPDSSEARVGEQYLKV